MEIGKLREIVEDAVNHSDVPVPEDKKDFLINRITYVLDEKLQQAGIGIGALESDIDSDSREITGT